MVQLLSQGGELADQGVRAREGCRGMNKIHGESLEGSESCIDRSIYAGRQSEGKLRKSSSALRLMSSLRLDGFTLFPITAGELARKCMPDSYMKVPRQCKCLCSDDLRLVHVHEEERPSSYSNGQSSFEGFVANIPFCSLSLSDSILLIRGRLCTISLHPSKIDS